MVSLDISPEHVVERLYAQNPGDPSFRDILGASEPLEEDDLADLIELDGRKRIALGRPIELGRYLEAIPGIASRTVALDAAIDVTLRSMSLGGRPDADAVGTLLLNYPQFERAIRDAAVLGRSMLSTTDVHKALAADLPAVLPCDFGPALPDGRARYELLQLIGTGATGAVYRANDRQLADADCPAVVAIKLMRFKDGSPWARQRFVEEATKARRIVHPNVARVLDRGVANDKSDYIVYEYIGGGDLHTWFQSRRGPLPDRQAASIVARVARAVHAAHVAGLVHCDLKPGNILLTESGEPKVTDFGIAVRAAQRDADSAAIIPDRPIGSLGFAAPEQLRLEEGALTTPADVYAIGGILFYLLTGRLPNGQTPEEVHAAQDRASGRFSAPSPRAHRTGLDADLDAICRRSMSPAPEGRHGSASELAADLESWLAHEPIGWTSPSLPRQVRLWSRRRPWGAAALAAMLLVIAASGAVAIRSWSAAQVRAEEARLANARIDRTRTEAVRAFNLLKLLQAQHVERDLLPTVMAMEWLIGKTVLGTPEDRTVLWQDRVRIVSEMIDRARREGRADDVDILTWQSALAFWLVNDGKFDAAAPVLEDNIARWSAIARPGDTWLIRIRAIDAAATVQRVRAGGAPAETSADSPLRKAEAALLQADKLFKGPSTGTPVHLLVLRSLVDLYGPGLLDSPADLKKFEKKLAASAG